MKKQLYSKENQQDILAEILNTVKRPDLSHLTQASFEVIKDKNSSHILDENNVSEYFFIHNDSYEVRYLKSISRIPELVQCAEILFDLTQNEPSSMNHKIVSDLLNSLKL